VSAAGFGTVNQDVVVQAGQITTVNISLAVATAHQVVTVAGTGPLLQIGSGSIATTLTERQVTELPDPGNDLSYFGELSSWSSGDTQSVT